MEAATTALLAEPCYGKAPTDPEAADADQRMRWVRHALARRLLDDPVTYLDDLGPAERGHRHHRGEPRPPGLRGRAHGYGVRRLRLGNFVYWREDDESGRSGVLLVTATGRHVDTYSWVPARITSGIPVPATSDAKGRHRRVGAAPHL